MTNHKLAFVFPGQGSQSVGMLAEIAAQYSEVQNTFAQASAVLGYDLWHTVQHGPVNELDKTIHTQPALLAAAYAIWKIIQTRSSIQPHILAGHSLGEYTALVCANAIDFADAIKLVAARGQYMQDAVVSGTGAMAAIIGLDDDVVVAICKQVRQSSNEIVDPANYNSVGQVVVAGHKGAVERVILLAKAQGAKLAMIIPVSVPSHCQLMEPAANRVASLLQTISLRVPTMSVINNADVRLYENIEMIRDGLVRQLYMPVRWVETIQFMIKQGVTRIVECGPGKVLTGLNKRIDKNLQLISTTDLAGLESLLKLESARGA